MKKILIALVRFYRKYISPAFPSHCRFIPTCSQYAIEALETANMISSIPSPDEDRNLRRNLCHYGII